MFWCVDVVEVEEWFDLWLISDASSSSDEELDVEAMNKVNV